MMDQHAIPVLVGVGQTTDKGSTFEACLSPLQLLMESVKRALEDAGIHLKQIQSRIDTLVITSGFIDYLKNPPQALCNALNIHAKNQYLSGVGGCSPQAAVNRLSEDIANLKIQCALLGGMEAQAAMGMARKAGIQPDWDQPSDQAPELFFPYRAGDGACETEMIHGIGVPVNVYPMFENALRSYLGRSFSDHQSKIADLFSRFSRVAEKNSYAWFPKARSAQEIMTVTGNNRYVGFPYTKLMNSMLGVNQSAAVLLMSEAMADELGVRREKRVYLHGCADAADHWYVLNRVNYYSSPAIKLCGKTALDMAGKTMEDMDHIDLYSCFPCAVEIARDMLGMDENDSRPLTVTGGLPYFGGPGNNYVMHSLAAMVEKLRENPGKFGLLNGNSYYLSKHSVGIYNTLPLEKPWQRTHPDVLQKQIHATKTPEIENQPKGSAAVETYTVLFNREGQPEKGLIIGRTENQPFKRFAAITPADPGLWQEMMTGDFVGTRGIVRNQGRFNVFEPI
ncbi:MAG: acetyl-CoA acetyltransferase [Desulfobacteraceae bacterium]|nr:acetyl-CoA acetyltransferase [Desulfobacteraceae bacterium]